jgi:hypothetical protein
MKKLTLSELKRRKTVKVKRTLEVYNSINDLKEFILNKLDKNGIDRSMLQENETQFFINNQNGTCSYWTKPKIFEPTIGTITFRSKDYYFTYIKDGKEVNSYGEIKAENLTENGFYLTMHNGNKIIYEIID